MRKLVILSVAALFPAAAFAAPVVDGSIAGDGYGPEVVVQDTATQFGNSNLGQLLYANGSELAGAYAKVDGGNLYLLLSGNLESNFNKLEIFIDSKAGGQNKLRGDNPDVDFNGLNRMGDDGSGNGLTFDSNFASDHFITVTGGNTGSGFQLFANYAETNTGGGGVGQFLGGSAVDGNLISGALGIDIAINNSNVSDFAGVGTGVELKIPLSLLAADTNVIKVSAMINGGGHDFLSNQVLGPATGANNLGEPRRVDFNQISGDQYFRVVIPEPATLGLLAGAGLLALRRRA